MRWPLSGRGEPRLTNAWRRIGPAPGGMPGSGDGAARPPGGASLSTAGTSSGRHGRKAASGPGPGTWRRLTPLTATAAQSPPLLSATLLALPDIGGTRPLLRPGVRPGVRPAGARSAEDGNGPAYLSTPPAGRVGGLVTPRAVSGAARPTAASGDNLAGTASEGLTRRISNHPAVYRDTHPLGLIQRIFRRAESPPPGIPRPDGPAAALAAAGGAGLAQGGLAAGELAAGGPTASAGTLPAAMPPRAISRVTQASERHVLTEATAEYVGEPQRGAEPYRSSAWLRATMEMAAAWQPPGETALIDRPGLANSEPTGSLPGAAGTAGRVVASWQPGPDRTTRGAGTAIPSKGAGATPGGGAAPDRRAGPGGPLRRANLAQSRRLGLGRSAVAGEPPAPAGPAVSGLAEEKPTTGSAVKESKEPQSTGPGSAGPGDATAEGDEARWPQRVPPGGPAGPPPRPGLGAPLGPSIADAPQADLHGPGHHAAASRPLPPHSSTAEAGGIASAGTANGNRIAVAAAERPHGPGRPRPAAVLPVYRSALIAGPPPPARPHRPGTARAPGTAQGPGIDGRVARPRGSRRTSGPSDGRAEAVPADLASAFAQARGVDVSAVPVYRGSAVSARARVLRARAYSRDGAVFLPGEAGPLNQAPARSLLAHELAHVAQDLLGYGLPEEGTTGGLALEADAVATERWAAGEAGSPPNLTGLPGQGTRSSGAGTLRRAPLQVDMPPGSALDPVAEPTSPLPGATAGTSHSLIPSMWPEASTPATAVAEPASAAPVDAELAAARGRLLELAAQRLPDMDDPAALDELASLLYPRLHREIRLELLIDRERSGLLSDFR